MARVRDPPVVRLPKWVHLYPDISSRACKWLPSHACRDATHMNRPRHPLRFAHAGSLTRQCHYTVQPVSRQARPTLWLQLPQPQLLEVVSAPCTLQRWRHRMTQSRSRAMVAHASARGMCRLEFCAALIHPQRPLQSLTKSSGTQHTPQNSARYTNVARGMLQ